MHLGGTRLRPAIAATILLFVAACSGPQPIEPAPTTSAAPTPTVAAPVMPDQAQENTPEGAAAFVKHYIDVFNYASNTGNTAELRKLSASTCDGCHSYIDLYEKTYKAGGYFKDSGWRILDSDSDASRDTFAVSTKVEAPATEYRLSKAEPPKTGEAGVYQLLFEVSDNRQMLTFQEKQESK